MIEIDVCIPIIAAIIGIGYPILLQAVTSLEEKYNSNAIIELFKSEPQRLFLLVSVIISLVSALLVLLNRPPWFDFGVLNSIVDNSAVLLLILFTIILVIAFFLFVSKVLIYNSKQRFIVYLIKEHSNPRKQKRIFKAISDLLYYSIRTQDSELALVISRFIYDAFSKQRGLSKEKPVEYPIEYYELAYKTTEELVQIKDNRLLFLETRSAGAIWLLGENKDFEISETTYRWLWRNILVAIRYNKDNMLMSFWETSHQYFTYNLRVVDAIYITGGQIENADSIDKRNLERRTFLEFTQALGGLLLYKKKYTCIARFFRYTTSIPPVYELLPNSMDQVFDLYFKFRDPHENNFPWITHKYYFPELEGLNADYIIKNWICAYVSILFLRQYKIITHYIYEAPLAFPTIPKTRREKRDWIDNLDHFKELVNDNLNNNELIATLNLDFITKEWCEKNERLMPLDYIDELKKNVINEYEKQEVEQELSQTKIDNFFDSVRDLVPKALKRYESLNNKTEINENYKELFIVGERAVIDKSPFTLDQESENLNYDSFLPESLSNKIHRGMSEIIYAMKTKTYVFKAKDIFDAIDKLEVNSEEYLILNFGNYMPNFFDDLKIAGLSQNKYLKTEIINFEHFHFQLIGTSFFIIKRADLPNIEYLEIKKEEIDKFELKLINKDFNIYGSVLDLFKRVDLHQDYLDSSNETNLNKSALLNISLSTRVRWKKSINVVQIRAYSDYREKGSTNELKEIVPLK